MFVDRNGKRGGDGYRLRVGGWWVIYAVNDRVVQILVIKAAPRGEAYR